MTATLDEVRKKFVDKIVRGDYLSNRVGTAPLFYQAAMDEDEITEPRIPRFYETYGANKEKERILVETLPRWELDLGESVKNLDTLLAQYPELQKDIDYADYLAEKFEKELRKIHNEHANQTKEEIEAGLEKLSSYYQETQLKSGGFYHEADAEYTQHQKEKAAEMSQPPEGNRR